MNREKTFKSNQLKTIQTKIKNLKALKHTLEVDLDNVNTLLEWERFYEAYSVGDNYIIDIKAFNSWLKLNHERIKFPYGTINHNLHFAYGLYLNDETRQ